MKEQKTTQKRLESFRGYLINRGYSKDTIRMQMQPVGEFLGWCQEQPSDPETDGYERVLGFVSVLRKRQLKANTIRLYVTAIKLWYSHLVKEKVIEHHPCLRLNIVNVQREMLHVILTGKELDELYLDFGNVGQSHGSIPKILLGLLLFQRIGSGDAKRLLCEHFNLEARTVSVPAGKRSNYRLLPLKEEQLPLIREHIEAREAQAKSLFVDTSKVHLYNQFFIYRLCRDYEKVVDLNQLRASVAVHWLTVHNLREVQYKCGHRYASSTERYLLNDIEALHRDIDRFHPLSGL